MANEGEFEIAVNEGQYNIQDYNPILTNQDADNYLWEQNLPVVQGGQITANESKAAARGSVATNTPWYNTPEGYKQKVDIDTQAASDAAFWKSLWNQPAKPSYNDRVVDNLSGYRTTYGGGGGVGYSRGSGGYSRNYGTVGGYDSTYNYTPQYVSQKLREYYDSLGDVADPTYVAPTAAEIRAETQKQGGAEAARVLRDTINTFSRNAMNQVNASGGYMNPYNTKNYIGKAAEGADLAWGKNQAEARRGAISYLTDAATKKYQAELAAARDERENINRIFSLTAPTYLKYYGYSA